MNDNKKAVINAIWQDPARLFGGQWKQGRNSWEYKGGGEWNQRGAVRLLLTPNGENIRVFFNHGTGRTNDRPDVFAYVEERDGLDFYGVLRHCAEIYRIDLHFTAEEKEKINRQTLAREVAASLVEALRSNPDGETARYLRGRGLRIDNHFGELTEQSIVKATEALRARGKTYNQKDFVALGLTVDNANNGYNLVIPKYTNGVVSGLVLRNIKPNHYGPKYWAASGVERAGYCDRLTVGDPAIIVEGEIDAITLIQAGVTNVVAMGGATMNDQAARLLRSRNISDITYIPDLEYNEQGEQKTDIIKQAIDKFLAAKVDGERVVNNLYIAELYAPDGADLHGLKVDVNDFAKTNGAAELAEVVNPENVTASWEWEINELLRWGTAQETVSISTFQSKFDAIYNRCANVYERERIKRYVDTNHREAFREFGVTPQALNDRDEWNRGKDYNNRVKALSAELSKAVEDGANPATVCQIVAQLNDTQSTNTRDEWDRQLNETFDDELDAIRNQPDTLKTKWELYKIGPNPERRPIPYEPIEFWPADITVFCAPTSHGKTMILFQSVMDLIASTDKTYLFVSCEENKRQLLERALNVYMDVQTTPNGKTLNEGVGFISGTRKRAIKAIITNGKPPKEYKTDTIEGSKDFDKLAAKVNQEIERYRQQVRPRLKLVHTDATIESITANVNHTVEDLRAAGVEVGGVFVDYMQLLSSEHKNFSRHDELKDVCTALRACAGRLELPVVIAAQLNRQVLAEGIDNITVANIGEGADIERIAHDIYLVWQVDKTKEDSYFKPQKNENDPREWDYTKARDRANRIFAKDELHPNQRELKTGYIYIEQLKARDGKTGGWGLLPFDGERGYIGENDTEKMAK